MKPLCCRTGSAVMSARPGRFIETLTTGWPRERDSSIVSDRAFGDLTAAMWSRLRTESMRSMRGKPCRRVGWLRLLVVVGFILVIELLCREWV